MFKIIKIAGLMAYSSFTAIFCKISALLGIAELLEGPKLFQVQDLRHIEILQSLTQHSPKTSLSVLDIGCGRGELLKKLKDKGYSQLYGIDFHERDINWATFKQMDVENFDENTFPLKFDVIILSEVLEHLENPAHALRVSRKVLKDDGIIIMTIPNSMSIWEKINYFLTADFKRYKKEKVNEYGHISIFSESTLFSLCQRASLRIEKCLGGIMFLNGFLFFKGSQVSKIWSYHSLYIIKSVS